MKPLKLHCCTEYLYLFFSDHFESFHFQTFFTQLCPVGVFPTMMVTLITLAAQCTNSMDFSIVVVGHGLFIFQMRRLSHSYSQQETWRLGSMTFSQS